MEINTTSMNNEGRAGRFTSSKLFNLVKKGRSEDFDSKGLKYIQEKAHECRFETTLDTAPYNEAMAWGNLMEQYVYDQLGYNIEGVDYELASKDTLIHPDHDFWSGTPDLVKYFNGNLKSISEIKCYQKRKFGLYVDCMAKKDVELFKKEYPQEYWQIVSNACIMGVDYGEVLAFMPYKSQIDDIRDIVNNMQGDAPWKYRFILEKDVNDLPFLPDDGYYDSVNMFEFEIPFSDKILLTNRVVLAEERKQSLL